LALFLAGCASTPVGGPGVKPISVTGSYTHAPSRFVFPESFGKFRRVEINQYDSSGNDVGVGYNLDAEGMQVALTLYVYPPRRAESGVLLPLQKQFDLELSEIVRGHTAAKSVQTSVAPGTQNEETNSGFMAKLRYTEGFAGQRQSVVSLFYLFEYDGWLVKYRITYPAAQEEKANLVAQVFVSEFRWRTDK
jgi:hypothetical protein